MIDIRKCALAGAQIVSAQDTRHRFMRHAHDFAVVGVFTEGAQISRYGLREFDIESGDVVLVPPGEIHDGRPLGGTSDTRARSYVMAYLNDNAFTALARTCDLNISSAGDFVDRVVVRGDKRAARAVTSLIAALARPDGLDDAAVVAFGALTPYSVRRVQAPLCPDLARRVRKRLDDTDEPLSDMADSFGVSRFALLRCFQKHYGLTPSQYRRQRRVQTACALMGQASNLTDVAFGAGFADQSHFIRDFKATFGVTPGAFRSAYV